MSVVDQVARKPKPATPGSWYTGYQSAWRTAHPGAMARGKSPGTFAMEDGLTWWSSTLLWDIEWFAQNGMSSPRAMRVEH